MDGAALAGALALGAELGYIGSRFLAADECEYHEANKRFIVEASETQTEVEPAFFLVPPGSSRTDSRPRCESSSNPTRRTWSNADRGPQCAAVPSRATWRRGMMIGGQGIGRIKEVLPAAEIVRRIAAEAEEALKRVAAFRVGDPMRA